MMPHWGMTLSSVEIESVWSLGVWAAYLQDILKENACHMFDSSDSLRGQVADIRGRENNSANQ